MAEDKPIKPMVINRITEETTAILIDICFQESKHIHAP